MPAESKFQVSGQPIRDRALRGPGSSTLAGVAAVRQSAALYMNRAIVCAFPVLLLSAD